MKKMKWMIAMLLVGALLLSGCSGGDTETEAEAETKAETQLAETAAEEAGEDGTEAENTANKDHYVIEAISDGLASPYQQGHYEWLEKMAEEKGWEVILIDGQVDPETKMKGCETLISRGVDVITVQANDTAGADSLIKEAHSAGIPLVNFYMPSENETAPAVVKEWYWFWL